MEFVLFLTSFVFLVSTIYFHNRVESEFNNKTKGILFTAAVTYSFMGLLFATNPDVVIRSWRYMDWFITVPLLLSELYLFLDNKTKNQKDLILTITFSLIMLGFGFLGELNYMNKWVSNILGSIAGVGIFYVLFKKIKKEHFKFLRVVAILWLFYPIVYVIQDSWWTILLFSLVDLTSKVGTAFYIKNQERYFN